MTAVGLSAGALLFDGLRTLGLSAVLCFVYHIVRLILPLRSRALSYAVHILLFAAFGLVFFCFILGETAAQAVRWNLLAGAAGGAAVYAVCFAPLVDAAARRLRQWAGALLRPAAALLRRARKKVILQPVSHLQNLYRSLYNERRKRREARAPRKESNGEEKRKEPIQVYTQT
ncbi:MAG: hypothetical protein VB021_05640 [Oscillospiraceae bacterium]|nr:hypothetical protein [Oscillospiraceae bacterium]